MRYVARGEPELVTATTAETCVALIQATACAGGGTVPDACSPAGLLEPVPESCHSQSRYWAVFDSP